MDPNEQASLESAKREIEKYLNHPYSRQIKEANEKSQQVFLNLIVESDVVDVQTLVSHFVMIGHLRGLRDSARLLQGTLDEIEENLKEAK